VVGVCAVCVCVCMCVRERGDNNQMIVCITSKHGNIMKLKTASVLYKCVCVCVCVCVYVCVL